jgi:protocatechuate 3,4-dioxygenase beta subunit
MSWVSRRPRALATLACVAAAAALGASALAGGAAAAAGEPGGGSGSNCPASTAPNAITLVAGTPQIATLNSAYTSGLQVALTNTDGCTLTSGAAGVAVTFTAPSSGASGVFSASGTYAATVGADSSGMVAAPTFTANGIAGSYTVTASSEYGTVTFALTNTAAGTPARLVAVSPPKQTATVAHGYRRALAVQVLDANGNPVAGASVTFTLTASTTTSACGTSAGGGAGSSADASFAGEASATSDADGLATSPALAANGEAGTFAASASLGSSGGSEPHGGGASGGVTPALFTLTNLAGAPAKLAPGVGATQSTRVGVRFPVSLAVTVTDALGNRVPDTLVSFAAPAAGASGRFTVRVASRSRGTRARPARTRQMRVASVRTDACGVAVAPALTATAEPGGYVVKASAGHARAAAFALVNEAT